MGEADTVLGRVGLGITLDEARRIIGPLTKAGGEWGPFWRCDRPEGELDLYEENGIVIEVDTFGLPTPRGLRIGDPQSRVEELYGNPDDVSEKYGEWIYEGSRPFKLVVGIRESSVSYVRIINFGLTEPKPDLGREIISSSVPLPLGPDDYSLAGFKACWTEAEAKADNRMEPHIPEGSMAVLGYTTSDHSVQLLNEAAGMNTYGLPRRLRVIVTGGPYQTPRDVRIGDPDSRVEALYGQGTRREEGHQTFLKYSAPDATLTFAVNLNGRVTAIELGCIWAPR